MLGESEQVLGLTADETELGSEHKAWPNCPRRRRVHHELRLRNHPVKVHRRGVRHEVVGAARKLTRDNVGATEVVPLAPELEGDEDEQPRLQSRHYPALNEGCDEVPRRLVLERSDLADVGVGKQGLAALVQLRDEARPLGAEGLERLCLFLCKTPLSIRSSAR